MIVELNNILSFRSVLLCLLLTGVITRVIAPKATRIQLSNNSVLYYWVVIEYDSTYFIIIG